MDAQPRTVTAFAMGYIKASNCRPLQDIVLANASWFGLRSNRNRIGRGVASRIALNRRAGSRGTAACQGSVCTWPESLARAIRMRVTRVTSVQPPASPCQSYHLIGFWGNRRAGWFAVAAASTGAQRGRRVRVPRRNIQLWIRENPVGWISRRDCVWSAQRSTHTPSH